MSDVTDAPASVTHHHTVTMPRGRGQWCTACHKIIADLQTAPEVEDLRVELDRLRDENEQWYNKVRELRTRVAVEAEDARARATRFLNEWNADYQRQAEEIASLANNAERAIAILSPLFVQAQESNSPDAEALGGTLDVLTGYFGQNGRPLRKLDELEAEVKRQAKEIVAHDRLAEAVRQDLNHDCVGRCAPISNRPGQFVCTERDGLVAAVIEALETYDKAKRARLDATQES